MSQGFKQYCPKCGANVEPGDAFCVNCGAKLGASTPVSQTAPGKREPEPPAKKPPNKAVRLLVTALIVALAYGGGKLLGGQMAGGFKTAGSAGIPTPTATALPLRTTAPLPTPLSAEAMNELLAVPTLNSGSLGASKAGWDVDSATDTEVRQAMEIYFSGTKNGAFAAFFADSDFRRGGLFYTDDTRALMWLGSWEDNGANDYVTLIDTDGEAHRVYITPTGERSMRLVSAGDVTFNMDLRRGDDRREKLYQLILNIKNGKYS